VQFIISYDGAAACVGAASKGLHMVSAVHQEFYGYAQGFFTGLQRGCTWLVQFIRIYYKIKKSNFSPLQRGCTWLVQFILEGAAAQNSSDIGFKGAAHG